MKTLFTALALTIAATTVSAANVTLVCDVKEENTYAEDSKRYISKKKETIRITEDTFYIRHRRFTLGEDVHTAILKEKYRKTEDSYYWYHRGVEKESGIWEEKGSLDRNTGEIWFQWRYKTYDVEQRGYFWDSSAYFKGSCEVAALKF